MINKKIIQQGFLLVFSVCMQEAMIRAPTSIRLTPAQVCTFKQLKVRDLKHDIMRDLNKEAVKLSLVKKYRLLRKWDIHGFNAANILKNARHEISLNIEESKDHEFDFQKSDATFHASFTYKLPNTWAEFTLVYETLAPLLKNHGIEWEKIEKWRTGGSLNNSFHETKRTAALLYGLLKDHDVFVKRAIADEMEPFYECDSADMLLLLAAEHYRPYWRNHIELGDLFNVVEDKYDGEFHYWVQWELDERRALATAPSEAHINQLIISSRSKK